MRKKDRPESPVKGARRYMLAAIEEYAVARDSVLYAQFKKEHLCFDPDHDHRPVTDDLGVNAVPLDLTPTQALGVATSIVAGTLTMGECQAAAPGMLEHLHAMGFDVVRTVLTEERHAEPQPAPGLAEAVVFRVQSSEALAGMVDDLAEAYGIIANAGGGNWTTETKEWRKAAIRWRDRVMPGVTAQQAGQALFDAIKPTAAKPETETA